MTVLSVLDQSPIRTGVTPAGALEETLRLAEACDVLGYHRYWLAEHHSSNGLAGTAPEIMIGQVAARTKGLRVGSGGVMLSHYSPLKVAETFRMLEALFPGRIDLGIGRAPGSDGLTAHAMTVGPGALDHARYPMQVSDLMGYLAGTLPEDHPFARVRAQPAGDTVPELWLLGSSDQSAQLAAYFGRPFGYAHFISAENGPQIMRLYFDNYRPSADWPAPRAAVAAFVICADTDEEAERLIRTRDMWTVRQRSGVTAPVPTVAEAEAYEFTPEQARLAAYNRNRWIWGAPGTAKAKLDALAAEFGVDELVIVTICPTFEARLRSYELLAGAYGLTPRES
ncbi:MAG: MsnO8 family LLM class oxidoreductase [Alphaproteobacteria bacterium]|nr:MsnO8 family LLM class oxidoreductase [Alphaproteobacteria bacterium]